MIFQEKSNFAIPSQLNFEKRLAANLSVANKSELSTDFYFYCLHKTLQSLGMLSKYTINSAGKNNLT